MRAEKLIGILIPCALALSPAAHAHEVRLSDGSVWNADHTHTTDVVGSVRMLPLNDVKQVDCDAATWPDIPPPCLQPEQTRSAASAEEPRRN